MPTKHTIITFASFLLLGVGFFSSTSALAAPMPWQWQNLTKNFSIDPQAAYYGLGFWNNDLFLVNTNLPTQTSQIFQIHNDIKTDITKQFQRFKPAPILEVIPGKSGVLFATSGWSQYFWKDKTTVREVTPLLKKVFPAHESVAMITSNGDTYGIVSSSGTVLIGDWQSGFKVALRGHGIEPSETSLDIFGGYYSPHRLPALTGYGRLPTAIAPYEKGFVVLWNENGKKNMQAAIFMEHNSRITRQTLNVSLTELDSIASNGKQVFFAGQQPDPDPDAAKVGLKHEVAYILDSNKKVQDISTKIFSGNTQPTFANRLVAQGALVEWSRDKWFIISGTSNFSFDGTRLVHLRETTDHFTSSVSANNGLIYLLGIRQTGTTTTNQFVKVTE